MSGRLIDIIRVKAKCSGRLAERRLSYILARRFDPGPTQHSTRRSNAFRLQETKHEFDELT